MSFPATWISCIKAGGIFLACLLASWLLPIICVYGHSILPVPDLLFFFPQLAFPYDNLVFDRASGLQPVFSRHAAATLSLIQWGLLAVGFSWLARHLKVYQILLAAVFVIVAATFLTYYGVKMFGATISLDGL
jgi:hypothetical protein